MTNDIDSIEEFSKKVKSHSDYGWYASRNSKDTENPKNNTKKCLFGHIYLFQDLHDKNHFYCPVCDEYFFTTNGIYIAKEVKL